MNTKTVRIGSRLEVGNKTYLANTYVVGEEEAARMIDAGAREIKPPRTSKAAEGKAAEGSDTKTADAKPTDTKATKSTGNAAEGAK